VHFDLGRTHIAARLTPALAALVEAEEFRAMGQAIRDIHISRLKPGSAGLRSVEAETPAGVAYLVDMYLARQYAAASR
jgi:hypothetical protein